jgi:hypothetical protein
MRCDVIMVLPLYLLLLHQFKFHRQLDRLLPLTLLHMHLF